MTLDYYFFSPVACVSKGCLRFVDHVDSVASKGKESTLSSTDFCLEEQNVLEREQRKCLCLTKTHLTKVNSFLYIFETNEEEKHNFAVIVYPMNTH